MGPMNLREFRDALNQCPDEFLDCAVLVVAGPFADEGGRQTNGVALRPSNVATYSSPRTGTLIAVECEFNSKAEA